MSTLKLETGIFTWHVSSCLARLTRSTLKQIISGIHFPNSPYFNAYSVPLPGSRPILLDSSHSICFLIEFKFDTVVRLRLLSEESFLLSFFEPDIHLFTA